MKWAVKYLPEAKKDLVRLDRSQQQLVLKAIGKVSQNPLPIYEGGYGKPLSGALAGCLKIKLRAAGLRVVYKLERSETAMLIVVVGVRADEEVYALAAKRMPR